MKENPTGISAFERYKGIPGSEYTRIRFFGYEKEGENIHAWNILPNLEQFEFSDFDASGN